MTQVESWFLLSPAPYCPRTNNVPWSRGTKYIQNEILLPVKIHTKKRAEKSQCYLLRYKLSLGVTLGDVSSHYRVPLWTGGLDTVSVVLTVSFRTLWFHWREQSH